MKSNKLFTIFFIVGAPLITCLTETTAYAQSSVSLYGIIDTGLTYANNEHGHSNWQATGSNINGTRWGLRGSEDLGGDLRAVFDLESGFNVTNGQLGQNGREFGRQAYVGLSARNYGTVTVGRQYDSVVDYVAPLSLTGTSFGGIQFAHPFDNDNLDNSFRINNSIKFASRNIEGVRLGALYGFSNAEGEFTNNRAYSIGGSYSVGALNLAAGYLQLDNAGSSALYNSAGAVTGDSTFSASLQRTWGAGVSYSVDGATAGFVFTQTRLEGATGIGAYASGTTSGVPLTDPGARFDNYEVNSRYALTSAITIAAAYTYTDGHLAGRDPHWNQVNLLGTYAFSRRTDIYLQAVFQHESGLERTGIGAGITGLPHASGDEQVAASFGIRHRF